MYPSKADETSSESDFQNSQCKEICTRCMRMVSDQSSRNSQRSISESIKAFKKLCENSKCRIHRKGSTTDRKSVKDKTSVGELGKNYWDSRKKSFRISIPDTPCEVVEFEDGDKNQDEDIDPQLYSKIETTVSDFDPGKEIKLANIVGEGLLKEIIHRTIIWPLKKPEIFKGLRSAPKGVLLFGPPGTGKTLIGQSIAYETKSTFFNISASSLTSKWMGESEQLVRTMFIVAKARQPSIIFIDEVDSILSQRTADENGSSRRMKNEFFIYMDGSATVPEDKIMVIGATSRPQELDEAARRRFFKRLYIPLPDESARKALLGQLLQTECHSLKDADIYDIVRKTEGYSTADLKNLSQEAAMGPIKSLSTDDIFELKPQKIRPISFEDFSSALQRIKPSISREEVKAYEQWDFMYGYGSEYYRN